MVDNCSNVAGFHGVVYLMRQVGNNNAIIRAIIGIRLLQSQGFPLVQIECGNLGYSIAATYIMQTLCLC